MKSIFSLLFIFVLSCSAWATPDKSEKADIKDIIDTYLADGMSADDLADQIFDDYETAYEKAKALVRIVNRTPQTEISDSRSLKLAQLQLALNRHAADYNKSTATDKRNAILIGAIVGAVAGGAFANTTKDPKIHTSNIISAAINEVGDSALLTFRMLVYGGAGLVAGVGVGAAYYEYTGLEEIEAPELDIYSAE